MGYIGTGKRTSRGEIVRTPEPVSLYVVLLSDALSLSAS